MKLPVRAEDQCSTSFDGPQLRAAAAGRRAAAAGRRRTVLLGFFLSAARFLLSWQSSRRRKEGKVQGRYREGTGKVQGGAKFPPPPVNLAEMLRQKYVN